MLLKKDWKIPDCKGELNHNEAAANILKNVYMLTFALDAKRMPCPSNAMYPDDMNVGW
jgi:hypothetical protein